MMRVVSRQAPEGALMVAFPRRRFGLVRLPTGHLPDEATGSQDTVTWLNTSTEVRRQTHVAQKAVPFPPSVDCLQ